MARRMGRKESNGRIFRVSKRLESSSYTNALKTTSSRQPSFAREGRKSTPVNWVLLTQAEPVNDVLVAFGIVGLQVVQQATPLADQHEKAAARTVVFLVRFEVLRQLTNAFAQQSDLDFWTARIGGMRTVLVNEGFLLLSG